MYWGRVGVRYIEHYLLLGVPPRNFHLVLQAPTAALQPRLDKMKALAEKRITGTILMWVSPTPATQAVLTPRTAAMG